jgi:hypothetical protein
MRLLSLLLAAVFIGRLLGMYLGSAMRLLSLLRNPAFRHRSLRGVLLIRAMCIFDRLRPFALRGGL